jgi:hypothetical protein
MRLPVILCAFFFAGPLAVSAEWKESRSGPFILYTDAGDDAARQALYQLEQHRFLFGEAVGIRDLKTLWPVTIVVQKAGEGQPFLGFGRTGWIGWWPAKGTPPPDFFRKLGLIFLEDNLKSRIPGDFEPAIASLYSTLRLEKNRAIVGDPPPPAERTRSWALLHRLLTTEETAARTRIVLSNLASGADIETAFRNAFEKPMRDFPAEPGTSTYSLMPRPLNPDVVFTLTPTLFSRARLIPGDLLLGRGAPPAQALAAYDKAQAERPGAGGFEGLGLILLAQGKTAEARAALQQMAADEENSGARGLFELARLQSDAEQKRLLLERASKKLPAWDEPYAELAKTESGPVRRAYWLKKATELKPRDSAHWSGLAQAQFEAAQYPDAEKSWRAAERAATTEADAASIRAAREKFEQERVDRQNAARRKAAEEEKAEIDRLREETMASIRRAEAKAGEGSASLEGKKIEKWWDGPPAQSFSGTLQSVECRSGRIRLALKDSEGKPFWLRVPDPSQVVVTGSAGGQADLKCGPQNPARKVAIQFTAPDVAISIEFQ